MRDVLVRLSAIALLLVASHDVVVSAKHVRRNVAGIKKSQNLSSGGGSSTRSGRSRGIKGARTLQNKNNNGRELQGNIKKGKPKPPVGILTAKDLVVPVLTATEAPETEAPTEGMDEDDIVETTAPSEGSTDLDATLEDGDTGIIGGIPANANEFPFYVKFEGGTLCGGSLIAPDTVLTAAHCVDQGRPNQVRIGGQQYFGGELIGTKCAVSHPDFLENDKTLMNDVAIIKLQNPVSDASMVIPYNEDTTYPSVGGTTLTVIGFGLTQAQNGDVSNVLQKLDTEFVSIEDCIATYSDRVVTPESHICADMANAGDCNGDSGGPVFDANGLQVGIVSFGYGGCASDQYQDVYVNIASFSEWIQRYALGDDCQPFEGDITETVETDTSTGTDTTDTTTGTDTTDTSGTEIEEEEEEGDEVELPEELDAFLDCFTTIYNLVNNLLGEDGGALGDLLGGGEDGKGGGGGEDGKGGGDVDNGKDEDKGTDTNEDKGGGKGADEQGAGKGAIREFFIGIGEIFGGGDDP